MITRLVKGLAAGVAGVAVAVALGAAPASAAYSYEWDEGPLSEGPTGTFYCVQTDYSGVCFEPYGDKIFVLDLSSADHASAVARWVTDYGRWGTCRNAHGAGTWAVCDKDFKEGATLKFRAAQYDGDTGTWWGEESLARSVSTG
ncbi:hypothetical protein AB0J74_12055 [Asanoa sp. NPDC049573]|uniref:hypothetical protein n=1 Tax=Asanoa sp. NPDC049573 TaxID=3155396 RepID=UPI00344965A5